MSRKELMARGEPYTDLTTAIMVLYGWTDMWYANPFEKGTLLTNDNIGLGTNFGPRWACGVWTGPQRDLVCLKECETNEEANIWLSPMGYTPKAAALKARKKIRSLQIEGRSVERD